MSRLRHRGLVLRLLLSLLVAILCRSGAWAGETWLGTVPEGVTADISGDRVVWGGKASGAFTYSPWQASAYVCDILTDEFHPFWTHTGSEPGTGFVEARVSGDRAVSWGYCLGIPDDEPSLEWHDLGTGSLLGELPIRTNGADLDGDLLAWADYCEIPATDQEDFDLTRAGAAYLLACAVAGGEENVPPGPGTPSFSDVPSDDWAYRYVEYCLAQGVMQGYSNGAYHPERTVTRDQMAVYFCRATSGNIGDEPTVPTFADVPADYWAYLHIEHLNTVVTDAASSTSPDLTFSPGSPMSALVAESWLEQGTGVPLDAFRILELPYAAVEGQMHVRNLDTAQEAVTTAPGALPAAPAASGNRVAWQDKRNRQWDIYLCDVNWGADQQKPIRITDDASAQTNPAVSGDVLVWQDGRSGNWDIYLYRVPASPTIAAGVPLTTDPADQMMPSVSGNLVVWQDYRNGNWDIYLYDLSTSTETRLTTDPTDQTNPRIDGRRVVYTNERNGPAICLYDLDAAAPTADFSANVQAGYAPLTVQFTNLSSGANVWGWLWDFGDGSTSVEQSPAHLFEVGAYTVSLTVSGEGGWQTQTKARYILATFPDVPFDPEHWALHEILACVDAGVVQGYWDGYHPERAVDRASMAAYIARALAGGDANVPANPTSVSFTDDVPADHWAYKYVEYAVDAGVVQGYNATHYCPDTIVTRDQMTVFVARAKGWASLGDDMTAAPQLFSDVPAGFWCGTAVQACVEHHVVQGYADGTYHPEREVTRDQMAVYVARAFELL